MSSYIYDSSYHNQSLDKLAQSIQKFGDVLVTFFGILSSIMECSGYGEIIIYIYINRWDGLE